MSEKRPRLLVAALISKPDPLRMLLTRHKGHGLWHFPDGEVRKNETLFESLKRSLKADIGVVPTAIDMRVIPIDRINRDKNTHILTLHIFTSLPTDAQFVQREGIETFWLPMATGQYSPPIRLLASTAEILCLLAGQ